MQTKLINKSKLTSLTYGSIDNGMPLLLRCSKLESLELLEDSRLEVGIPESKLLHHIFTRLELEESNSSFFFWGRSMKLLPFKKKNVRDIFQINAPM
jgi:hypothetical protein